MWKKNWKRFQLTEEKSIMETKHRKLEEQIIQL